MAGKTVARTKTVSKKSTVPRPKAPRVKPRPEPQPAPSLPDWARHQIERIQERAEQEQESIDRAAIIARAERVALQRTGRAGDEATLGDLVAAIWGDGEHLSHEALEEAADVARALCFVDDASLVRRLLDRLSTRSRLAVDLDRRLARAAEGR